MKSKKSGLPFPARPAGGSRPARPKQFLHHFEEADRPQTKPDRNLETAWRFPSVVCAPTRNMITNLYAFHITRSAAPPAVRCCWRSGWRRRGTWADRLPHRFEIQKLFKRKASVYPHEADDFLEGLRRGHHHADAGGRFRQLSGVEKNLLEQQIAGGTDAIAHLRHHGRSLRAERHGTSGCDRICRCDGEPSSAGHRRHRFQ